ncbi:putative mutS family protein, partial [Ixodes scapularis]
MKTKHEKEQAVQPTTGDVLYDSFQESSGGGELEQRLESLQPVEIVLSEKSSPTVLRTVSSYQSLSREGVRVEHLSPSQFDLSASLDALTKFYRRDGGESKGELATLMALPPVVVCCIGSLLGYLATFKLEEVLRDVSRFTAMAGECRRMAFTSATLRRLDLFRNSLDGTSRGSLLDVMDHTATAFGRRLLFSWLGQPLADLGAIIERQDAVEDILSSGSTAFSDLRKFLSRMPDVQRGLCAILHKKLSGQCQSAGAYLVSVGESECTTPNHVLVGIVAVQPTTGEVLYDSFQESSGGGELEQRLESLQPVEIVLSEKASPTVFRTVSSYQSLSREGVRVEHLSPSQFDLSASLDALTKFYRRDGVESKGELATLMALPPVVVCCIGSLLGYLATFKLEEVLRDVSRFTAMAGECRRMAFTSATLRRLDLFRNSLDGTSRGSLLDVMDHTATAFGRRLLFSWLGQPLADLGAIIERQDAVEDILSSGSTAFSDLRKFLSRMPDVQRGLCAILHKK